MLRYKRLILNKLEPPDDTTIPMQLRELARKLNMPVPSLHNYAQFDVLPRIDNIQKMADYFRESVSSMFSEDDDLTTELVAKIRALPHAKKIKLLKDLKNVRQTTSK